jgi:hypothetical protein
MPLPSFIRLNDQRPRELQDVHFHQGPQGQPTPCYDSVCSIPQMASDDVREAAMGSARRPRARSRG